uniref:Uncharacterized protein n=1 Tax=Oryza barthii TaxID=65489 RepID=A0A0D3F5N9_9ORYZ
MCWWPEEVEKQRQAQRFRRCKRQGTQFGTGRRRLARWSTGCSRCRYGKLGNDNPYLSSWKRLRWPPDVIVRWCVGMESELFARDGKLGNDNSLPLSSWQCYNGLGFVVGRERESGRKFCLVFD